MAHYWHGKESRWGDRVKVNIPVQVVGWTPCRVRTVA
jgi:hypothetical protein